VIIPSLVNVGRGRWALSRVSSRLPRRRPLFIAGAAPAAKKADLRCDDFDRSSLDVVLVLVFTNLKATLDEYGVAAPKVFSARGTNVSAGIKHPQFCRFCRSSTWAGTR